MATLLRAVRKASLASRAAVMASRSARVAGGDVSTTMKPPEPFPSIADYPRLPGKPIPPSCWCRGSSIRRSATLLPAVREASFASRAPVATVKVPPFPSRDEYLRLPDHAKSPTDKDMASDEGVWALYERWCKVFKKQHDPAEMAHRFKIFRHTAKFVHYWNTIVPADPKKAAKYLKKRRKAKLMILKGEDISDLDESIVPYQLGTVSSGHYPLTERETKFFNELEAEEARITVKDVISLNISSPAMATMASRSARAAARGEASTKPRDGALSHFASAADYAHLLPDDAKIPTDKDLESDEALRSLYERWCKAFNKERDQCDHAEMDCRFKLFRYSAKFVHYWNTFVPEDPEEAAIHLSKRREAELRLSKGQDITHFDECYLPIELGAFADGGDPYFNERDMSLLKAME